jgi:hypothetical protein
MKLRKIDRPKGLPHRFEHFDGGDGIILANNIAVIAQPHGDAILQPCLRNPLHRRLMDNPDFANATFDIHYVERLLKADEAAKAAAPATGAAQKVTA